MYKIYRGTEKKIVMAIVGRKGWSLSKLKTGLNEQSYSARARNNCEKGRTIPWLRLREKII